jgi:hypothetical protein
MDLILYPAGQRPSAGLFAIVQFSHSIDVEASFWTRP